LRGVDAAAYCAYEAAPYIENWVNNQYNNYTAQQSLNEDLWLSTFKDKEKNRKNLQIKDKPNSTDSIDWGNGKGTIRDYDSEGKAKTDYDFGHDHNDSGDPHAHDWNWSNPKDPRSTARPIHPGE